MTKIGTACRRGGASGSCRAAAPQWLDRAVPDADPIQATHGAVETVWRMESARLIAGLARMVQDVGLAEELGQDALVAALEQWPAEGVPANPGAWLMSTAKHRAIDQLRRRRTYERKLAVVGLEQESRQQSAADELD